LVCATARSSKALIIGRAIAGIGVGGLFTGSVLIVIQCGKFFENGRSTMFRFRGPTRECVLTFEAPLRQRPLILGVIGSMWAIASVAGPLLGGIFT
jgi:MFS family permease